MLNKLPGIPGQDLAWAVGKAVYWFTGIMVLAAVLTWMERKQSALMQDRIGANRARILGRPWLGLPHILADTVKLMLKEDFTPPGTPRWLHAAAPAITLVTAILPMAAIPFGEDLSWGGHKIPLRITSMNVGLVFALAVASLAMFGVVIAGWCTRNKWSTLGGLRAAAQFIAFGLVFGLAATGAVMIYGTLDLQAMVRWQNRTILHGWLPRWGIVIQPLGFLLFLAAGIAETKRIPFDLPEGESEIIGYFLEYSGMKFGTFFLADFVETVLVAMLAVTIFLGGWSLPYLPAGAFPPLWTAAVQSAIFWVKVFLVCWFMLLVRWTLPRFRIDQALRLGWAQMFPLAVLNVLVTGAAVLAFG